MAISKIFVNLPVKDLQTTRDFFTKVGFTINEEFSDENSVSLVISDTIHAMLVAEPFFKQFTNKEIADSTKVTESLVALAADSREEVDALVDRALAAGGTPSVGDDDQGFMYSRSFQDPDGHIWNVFYMDMSAMPQA